MSPHATLIDLLTARAGREPEKVGFIFLADGVEKERITYAALHRRACAVAGYLQASAVAGDRALLLLPSGLDFVVSFFAALYAGMIAVPAYPPSLRVDAKTRRLQAIVKDARPSRVLTTAALVSRLQGPAAALLGGAGLVSGSDVEDAWADRWQRPAITAGSMAFLQYTSGSTALPKGVMVSHGNILRNERMIETQFVRSAESTVVSWLPQYHDMGLIGGLLQPLYSGSPGVFLSPSAFLQQPIAWLRAISHYHAHTSGGPNFAYDLAVSTTTEEQRQGLDLGSWRVAFNGAEPVRVATIDRFTRAFEPHGFRRDAFFPCYGLAEATLIVTGRQGPKIVASAGAGTGDANDGGLPEHSAEPRTFVSCGTPVVETQVVIVDPVTRQPCADGQVGEIWVQGPAVTAGYWNQDALSAQTFGATLAGRPGHFLRTGDLGWLRDGELLVAGRLKDLIIIRGENHHPEDLELTASASHDALRFQQGAAFTADIDGVEQLVVLHPVDRANHAPLEEVARRLREAISQHHALRVHTIVFIDPAAMPRTSSGKVPRHACRAQFEADAFPVLLKDTVGSPGGEDVVKPANAGAATAGDGAGAGDGDSDAARLESALRSEIASAMKLPPAQLSSDRPLTAWGLDSLIATEIHHMLQERFNTHVPIASLLGGLTLQEILALVSAEQHAQAPGERRNRETQPARSEEASGLSVEQQRLWLLSRISPQKSAYNVSAALPFDGPLQPERLKRAVEAVVRRHDILRARISATSTGPSLHIAAPGDIAWSQQSIVAASKEECEQIARREGLRQAGRPFDLEQDPLIRFHLLTFGPAGAVLLVCAHHIITDAESFRILFEQVIDGYRTTPTAADPVAWQPWRAADDARIAPHLDYWRRQLADLPALLDFPHGHPAAAQDQDGSVEAFRFSIDKETVAGLRALGKSRSSTLFMLLLSGWNAAFHRWSGRRDWLAATPVSGRPLREQRDVIGAFAYPLLLRAGVSADMTLGTLIDTTRANLLQAYEHQEVPFTHVIESLRGQGRSTRTPRVQMLFSVLKMPDAAPPPAGDVLFGTPRLIRATTDVELFVTLMEWPDLLEGTLFYQPALVDETRMRALVQAFTAMLDAMVRHPAWTLSDVPLPPATRETTVDAPAALRICVAASFAADPLQAILEFWSGTLHTPWAISIAPPGQIMQALLDEESALARNGTGINILLLQPKASGLETAQTLDAIAAFQRRSSSPLIVIVCPEQEADAATLATWKARLAEMPGVHGVGPEELLASYPVDTVYDEFGAQVANLPFSDAFYVAAGTVASRRIRALSARPHKVIVLDCDHTLWNGLCAEDGPEQVRIDAPHAFLQRFVRAQKEAGVLLCLASKNSDADVAATFAAHPSMPLALEDFVARRINWLPKSENLASLALELGLALDSFIYIDDSALECAEVESRCPGVLTLCVQQAEDIPRLLEHAWAFDRMAVTDEDRRKSELYRQDADRRALTRQPLTMEQFLDSLDLIVEIAPVRVEDITRVAQLSSRVNQFNCSMRRYSEAEIAQRLGDGSIECLVAHVRDRCGDYGLVGAAVLRETDAALRVESFFLSCRALGRGVEYRLLNDIGARAVRRGLSRVEIDVQCGPRNTPALTFITGMGATAPVDPGETVTIALDAALASHVSYSDRVSVPRPATAEEAQEAPTLPPLNLAARSLDASALAYIATHLRSVTEIAAALQSSHAAHADRRRAAGADHAGVAASTDIEVALARIWEDIIGVPVTDVSQDLFELGGDSLLAVRILGRIRNTFSIELSLDDLFLGPLTVQGVAHAVEKASLPHATPSVS
jgi:FkbH-like protein